MPVKRLQQPVKVLYRMEGGGVGGVSLEIGNDGRYHTFELVFFLYPENLTNISKLNSFKTREMSPDLTRMAQ